MKKDLGDGRPAGAVSEGGGMTGIEAVHRHGKEMPIEWQIPTDRHDGKERAGNAHPI